ncbi:sigma-70 family RNA polymerase sigma factor [Herbaspirillum sp. HC18]|nr:sigma-70 family RNA polymerase sigma factor [Herbaspirillum sp. HC18]
MLNKVKQAGGMPSPTDSDDARLISHVAAGDMHAFELLYRAYFPKLTRFLDRLTRRPQLLEEIVNDTMLVVWQKANTFDLSCKPSTWIFAIAYRKALKALQLLDDPVECDFDVYPDEAEHEPDNEAQHHELHELLAQAVDTLTVNQRAVVCLTYFHGLGYKEISDIMDCPVNTVKTRMFYARRQLETVLTERMKEMR